MKNLKDAIAEYERLLRLKANYIKAIKVVLNRSEPVSGRLQFHDRSEGAFYVDIGVIFDEDPDNLHDALVCAVTRLDEKIDRLEPLLKLADEALNNGTFN